MENTTQPVQPITVADLDALRSIIDLAATRGAFQGAELSQVGAVYDKLTTFLNSVVAEAQAKVQSQSDAEPLSDNTQGV
jgi:hypothetical protein